MVHSVRCDAGRPPLRLPPQFPAVKSVSFSVKALFSPSDTEVLVCAMRLRLNRLVSSNLLPLDYSSGFLPRGRPRCSLLPPTSFFENIFAPAHGDKLFYNYDKTFILVERPQASLSPKMSIKTVFFPTTSSISNVSLVSSFFNFRRNPDVGAS